MSEEEVQKKVPKEKKSLFWRLFKITLFLGFFVFLMLTILTKIGGSSPIIREAIEDLLSAKTGTIARISKLNHMKFFPNISLDVEYVEFYPTSDEGDRIGDTMATVGKANIAFGFFDLLLGDGQIKHFEIENLSFRAGALLPKEFIIQKAILEETKDGEASLNITGTIGEAPLLGSIGFEAEGRPGYKKYSVGDQRRFSFNLADLTLTGHLENKTFGGLIIKDAKLTHAKKPVMEGNFNLNRHDDNKWSLKGKALLFPSKSQIEPDITLTHRDDILNLKGMLKSEILNINDLSSSGHIPKAITRLSALLGLESNDTELSLKNIESTLDLDIKALHAGDTLIGSLKTPLKIKDATLTLGPLKGKISSGTLKGEATLKTATSPTTLETQIKIKDLDYGALQKQFQKDAFIEGRGDAALNLSAKGKNIEALIENLKGKFTFVSGKGQMKSGMLDFWGGGLLNAMLPKFSAEEEMNLNCAVIDLDIEDQLVTSKILFIDTQRITLSGEGQYKIKTDDMDLKLTPKTKDLALGDIATAVYLTGPLSNLSVKPSALDIGKKIGGLLLGAINPAFYAISLVNLGLNDQHPCKAFVIEQETLSPPPEAVEPPPSQEKPPAPQEQEQAAP